MRSSSLTRPDSSTQPSLRISSRSAEGTVTVLPEGELDLFTAPQLVLALSRAHTLATPAVILDLSQVTFTDVSGVRAILHADARARCDGRDLQIIRCPRAVQRVFDLCLAIDPSFGSLPLLADP